MVQPRSVKLQPLDRLVLTLMVLLTVAIGGLLLLGDQAAARVRDFSWQQRPIGAEDIAFLMTFSRPMDHGSVEQNLEITPPLPGKFSWAGRRMAYTLDLPAPYGEEFTITLKGAEDSFSQSAHRFDPFSSTFKSRDRGFLYIGVEGEAQGRLMLYNLTQQTETALTPKDWVVLDFKPYPLGDRVLFAATDYQSYQKGDQNQQLYTVTTGLPAAPPQLPFWRSFWRRPPDTLPSGQIETVLDSDTYQNLKFDLSADGKVIVVQRLSRRNPAEFGPWVLADGSPPRPLETDPGGDFLIAPDSQSLLLQQGEGTAIIALGTDQQADSGTTLDFLPEYGLVLDVASDGSAATMVSFNQNDPEKRFTQTLFWVSNQGKEKPLLSATGAILEATFDPTNKLVYCLFTELLPGDTYQVQPYLAAIHVETGQRYDLLAIPPQPSVNMSLSPDGLAILFDETVAAETESSALRASDGRAIATGRLWLLPLFQALDDRLANVPSPMEPQALPFSGLVPVWLP